MPTPYNLNVNSSNFMEIAVSVNQGTNSLLGLGILIMIAFVLFFSMKDWPIKQATASSLFITSVIGILMFVGGLITFVHISVLIVLTALAGVSLLFD